MSDYRDKLPEKIIPISKLRIRRDKKKKCTCSDRNFEVDVNNKEVLCADCGAVVDPFEAMLELAKQNEKLEKETENLLKQKKQIANWQPYLLALRELERIYRGGKSLPCCAHCGRGLLAKELTVKTIAKEIEMEQRRFENKNAGS